MKVFMSIQLVGIFAGLPFLIAWLGDGAAFSGHGAAFWVAIVAYVAAFIAMTVSVYQSTHEW